MPSTMTTVPTSYGRTFVRISGPADAPPLVLLPGGGSSLLMWAPNVAALSERYRVYAIDRLGDIGRSVYLRPPERAPTSWGTSTNSSPLFNSAPTSA